MILSATREEVEIVRTALNEYNKILRERARVHCSGHSEKGIALCVERMQVETVLSDLEKAAAVNRRSSGTTVIPPSGPANQAAPVVVINRAA